MSVRRSSREKGAALIMTALMVTGLVVMAGLVLDTASLVYQRTRMQVAADAAALAGARGLTNGSAFAIAQAQSMAAKNGYTLPAEAISIENGSRMTVTLETPVNSLVGRVLQVMTPGASSNLAKPFQVGATSTADLRFQHQSEGLRPFGVPEQDFHPGIEYVLKAGAGGSIRGNFQALALDGPGANLYRNAILNGAQTSLKVGDLVSTEPGNIVGPTVSAINQLIGPDQTGYRDATQGAKTPRVITVPLLSSSYFAAHGRSNVTIAGFARFYITYTTSRGEVYGRFIDRLSRPEVPGTGSQYYVRLVDASAPLPPALSVLQ